VRKNPLLFIYKTVVTHYNNKIYLQRKVVQINEKHFGPVLLKIIDSLHESSNKFQAEYVKQILSAIQRNDVVEFKNKIVSVEMWGGSGSVWEVGGFNSQAAEKEFVVQIVKLIDLMKESGIKSKAARSVRRALQRIHKL